MNILIVNVCKEGFHYLEFVKPVEDVLRLNNISFQTLHYKQLDEDIVSRFNRVIICGTSLLDSEYLDDVIEFGWVKSFKGKILGICAGMQILGRVFGDRVYRKQEIGFFRERFDRSFFGLKDEVEVYHLHNNYVAFDARKWSFYTSGKVVQAVKKKRREVYGVLFHPEVRNKDLILKFIKG